MKITFFRSLKLKLTIILLTFSSFFLYGVLGSSPIQPIYLGFLLSVSYILMTFKYTNYIKISSTMIIYILIGLSILFLFFVQDIRGDLADGYLKGLARIYIPMLYYPLTIHLLRNEDKDILFKIINIFIKINIFMYFIDFIYRFINVGYISFQNFYIYKYNSIFYADSNFIAVMILGMFFFLRSLEEIYKINYNKEKLILFILLLFTFSRAAIVSFIILNFFKIKKYSILEKVMIFLLLSLLSFLLWLFFSDDGSLITKFEIIDFSIRIMSENIGNFIFGIGSGNLKNVFIRESHNLIGLTAELGFLGILIYSFNLWYIYKQIKIYFIYIFLPILISGLSMFPITYLSPIYIMFAFIFLINVKKEELL
ncbi:hypothetical protein [Geotoga petraea]|uniref:O-antigen ligase domain-containing protein n=1 Tax=Geotoga petraea TaxID=28234 RepID=A0A4Z0W0J9_9BACT|nr:hypothetical protein [Geotoga petraea]TGG88019.1 hypothetical protein E4650_06660 [Geotoga petraea]